MDLTRAGLFCGSSGMQVVDFFNLERSLQDRFVEAANGAVAPTPLAFRAARPRAGVLGWWAICLVATISSIALLGLGFGFRPP